MEKAPSPEEFLKRAEELKYYVYKEGTHSYNLNIVGWRAKDIVEDKFNDIISVYWKENGIWKSKYWKATTLPGVPWLLNPVNKNGTAIMVPGQYPKAYVLSTYKGYKALKQLAPIRVYRDVNRDSKVTIVPGNIEIGVFGIHIHKAGWWSKLVGTSSAGCQVFQRADDFNEFISLCEQAAKFWGEYFTYTLIDEI